MEKAQDPRKEVGLITTFLDKSIRQFILYGRSHPQFQSSLRDFEDRLKIYLEKDSSLVLEVTRAELVWNEEPIFALTKRDKNYIQEMYVDGIRQLQFLPNVTRKELEDFVGVLGRDTEQYEVREDDTVTMLWKTNLQNIRYKSIDIYATERFTFYQELNIEEDLSEDKQQEKHFLDRFISQIVEPDSSKLEDILCTNTNKQSLMFKKEIEIAVPKEKFKEMEEQKDRLNGKIQKFLKRDYFDELLVLFSEVLEEKHDLKSLQDLVASYMDVVRTLMEDGNLKKVIEWISSLRAVQEHCSLENPDVISLIDKEIKKICTAKRMHQFGARLESGFPAAPKDVLSFLKLLGSGITPEVLELLSVLKQETLHSTIVNFLTLYGSKNVEVYRRYLKRPEWMLIRDIIRILAILCPETRLYLVLQDMMNRREEQIRLEVIRTMKSFTGPEAREYIKRGISDSAASVRMLSFQLITRAPAPTFSKTIAKEITKENFVARSLEEKKKACVALAKCAESQSLGFLEQVLRRSRSGSFEDDLRIGALYGISEIQNEDALRVLKEFSSKVFLKKNVRDVAKRLLERLKT